MPVTIADLAQLSILIAGGFLLAVLFYESLSTRDVLVARAMRVARRMSRATWFVGSVYVITVGIGIPIMVVLWTAVLEVGLFFVGSIDRLESVALVAVAVVGATRILAYAREKTSHELAKAIPLSFAFLLLSGGSIDLEERLIRVSERPEGTALTETMIAFLVGLEIGLRLLTDASHAVLAAIRHRRGIDSDLGVWRTLWSAIRGPRTAAPGDRPGLEPDRADLTLAPPDV